MSQTVKMSIPADNPEYFNSSRWLEPAVQSSVTAPQVVTNPIMETPVQVLESIKNIDIDKMVAKDETKTRSKKRLGPLKRLFRSASRRESASEVEVGFSNINSSPLPPVPHTNHYASLPLSPRIQLSEKTQAGVYRVNEGAGDRLNNNNKPPSGNIIPPSLRHRYLCCPCNTLSLIFKHFLFKVPLFWSQTRLLLARNGSSFGSQSPFLMSWIQSQGSARYCHSLQVNFACTAHFSN